MPKRFSKLKSNFVQSFTFLFLLGFIVGAYGFFGDAQGVATVQIQSKTVAPGATTRVRISIAGAPAPGVVDFQVGSQGKLTFDPAVVQVTAVRAISPVTLLASDVDNDNGRLTFAAASLGAGLSDGDFLELDIKAVGSAGERSTLTITAFDVLRDKNGNNITPSLNGGTVTLSGGAAPPPLQGQSNAPNDLDGDGHFEDVNGDGAFNIDDAIVLARAVLIFNDPVLTQNVAAFDFNEDGNVDVSDVISIARKALLGL